MNKIIALTLFSLLITPLKADYNLNNDILENIYNTLLENNEEHEIDLHSIEEELNYLCEHPINLNNTSKDELENIPFLSAQQIEELLYYIYIHSPMHSIYELQLVDGFYKQDIMNLLPFVFIGKPKEDNKMNWKELLRYYNQEIICSTKGFLNEKKGYKEHSYLGSPIYNSVKYRLRFNNKINIGLTVEKDAGEMFLNNNKLYDFRSAYLELTRIGKLKKLILGDFKANFAQGLICNNNFSFGKSSSINNLCKSANGFNKYSSTNEFNYFRGAALSIEYKKLDINCFYSNRDRDGAVNNNIFSSFKKDGYHRTTSELNKKNAIKTQTGALNLNFSHKRFQLGSSFMLTSFSDTLVPTPRPYNKFYFKGYSQLFGSIDYKWKWHRLFFFGEGATSSNLATAIINGVNINPYDELHLTFLYRNYSKNFDPIFSNAFSENSTTNNENGIYIGIECPFFSNGKFSAYFDTYKFNWLKYAVNKPSYGNDLLLQSSFDLMHALNIETKFRYEEKEKNSTKDTPIKQTDLLKKIQLYHKLTYSVADNILLVSNIKSTYIREQTKEASWGILLSQELRYKMPKFNASIDIGCAYFDIPNYENRIYSYEKDILYAFSFPMYYHTGNRVYVNLKMPLNKLTLYAKINHTKYIDLEEIGSGLEKITGNTKTEVKLLLRWKF